jgi:putative endonuclease
LAFWAYILQSESTSRYYCGHSSDPNRRLRQHNDPEYQTLQNHEKVSGTLDACLVSRVSKPWSCHEIRKDHQKTGNRSISIECSVGRVPPIGGINHLVGSSSLSRGAR